MKRTAITILSAVLTAGGAFAQSMTDAYHFSENNYEGTARTIAMGNAFTALGGDLGAVTINPAGSAVARYSQFTITPSVNVSVNKAVGTPLQDGTSSGFGTLYKNTQATGALPNIGFSLNFDTHRDRGIKNIAVGVTANISNTYMDNAYARGSNKATSFMGAMAYQAQMDAMEYGYTIEDLLADGAWDNPNLPWYYVLGAQAGFINGLPDGANPHAFFGSSENIYQIVEDGTDNPVIGDDGYHVYDIELSGAMDQTYNRKISGYKYDYVFNLAFNISDFLFIGANLGMQTLKWSSEEMMLEKAMYQDLSALNFRDMKYRNNYMVSGVGVYGKFGIIATPVQGLRLGAAIQTPTSMHLTEQAYMSGSTSFANISFNASAETPETRYEYRLVSPFRFNVGAAFTFGTFGLVSADYELCDYSAMRYRSEDSIDNSEFDNVNTEIKDYMGKSHNLRVGAEFKLFETLAFRAGYGLATSPYMKYEDDIKKPVDNISHRFSFGLGYDSGRTLFADLACAARMNKDYIYPYADYLPVLSPEIENRRTLWTVALTLGLRF